MPAEATIPSRQVHTDNKKGYNVAYEQETI